MLALGFGSLLLLSLSGSPLAAEVEPDYRELHRRGNSQVRTGSTLVWSGLALLPVSAIALIPVFHDGAFGITAADPGFAIFFAVAGGGLIHAGIPLVGFGSEQLERAAYRLAPGSPGSAEAGWSHYRRSWKFLAGGTAALLTAFPFAVAAALDWEREDGVADYLALGLGSAGLGLMAASVLEQHYSLYRFAGVTRDARKQLRAFPVISLVPELRWEWGGMPRTGMHLVGSF